jgi:ubiquinol-cytochrome c reductase iron-sulfur subunit
MIGPSDDPEDRAMIRGSGGPGQVDRAPTTGKAIGIAFLASIVASIALAVVYFAGGQPQLEGTFLFIALGGIGVGLILWGHRFLPVGRDVQEREPMASPAEQREEAEEALGAGAEMLSRRRALFRMLGAALAALGLAALFPIRSLGRAPGGALFHTAWRPGSRAVDANGDPVAVDAMSPGQVVTVFPEGSVGSADSQTLLIGLEPSQYHPLPGRENWAPNGVVGFSKVCTHAGCPVGLYQPSEHRLFCPCHQSVFDVLQAARPVGGPASRPLPQLPLTTDPDGNVVARSDYTEPIGPGFWDRGGS